MMTHLTGQSNLLSLMMKDDNSRNLKSILLTAKYQKLQTGEKRDINHLSDGYCNFALQKIARNPAENDD
jgi:hypothetical protein